PERLDSPSPPSMSTAGQGVANAAGTTADTNSMALNSSHDVAMSSARARGGARRQRFARLTTPASPAEDPPHDHRVHARTLTICVGILSAALAACAPEHGGPAPRMDPPRAQEPAEAPEIAPDKKRSVPATDSDAEVAAEPEAPPERDGPRLTSIAS